jgi:hypothetical protein
MEEFVKRIVADSAPPHRTLLAVSYALSGGVVWAMRFVFGDSG